jgi:hypothetical protein
VHRQYRLSLSPPSTLQVQTPPRRARCPARHSSRLQLLRTHRLDGISGHNRRGGHRRHTAAGMTDRPASSQEGRTHWPCRVRPRQRSGYGMAQTFHLTELPPTPSLRIPPPRQRAPRSHKTCCPLHDHGNRPVTKWQERLESTARRSLLRSQAATASQRRPGSDWSAWRTKWVTSPLDVPMKK